MVRGEGGKDQEEKKPGGGRKRKEAGEGKEKEEEECDMWKEEVWKERTRKKDYGLWRRF